MIFADTETTDLVDPKVCSIAMIKVDDSGNVIDTLFELINPEKDVSPEASKVNGFTLESLKQYKTFSELADKIIDFVGKEVVVFHNADFDMSVLNKEFEDCKKSVHWRIIDTLRLSCDVLNSQHKHIKHNLNALTEYYKLSNLRVDRHDALIDTKMLKEVYYCLIKDYKNIKNSKDFWTRKGLIELASYPKAKVCIQGKCFNKCDINRVNSYWHGYVWLKKDDMVEPIYTNKITFNTRDGKLTFYLDTISIVKIK